MNMTEDEIFDAADAYEGTTMITFPDKAAALRYCLHRQKKFGVIGTVVGVEDTREGTGLFVLWRDPVPPDKMVERLANCRWLLEATLAGEYPMPVAGEINEHWTGGFPEKRH